MRYPIYPSSAIITHAKNTRELGRRYRGKLKKFGINDDYLTRFENDIDDAEALPEDEYKLVQVTTSTEYKDEVLDDCAEYVRDFIMRAEMAYGKNSELARLFTGKEINRASRSEGMMMEMMETVIRLSEEHQEKLEPHGLTPAVLQEGKDLLEELQQADAVQELKKIERPSATVKRVKAYQLVYDTTNEILKAGRRVFKKQPEIYRLFRSPWGQYRRGNKSTDGGGESDTTDDVPDSADED